MILSDILKKKISEAKAHLSQDGDFQKAHHAAIKAQKLKNGGVIFTFKDKPQMYFENLYWFTVERGDILI